MHAVQEVAAAAFGLISPRARAATSASTKARSNSPAFIPSSTTPRSVTRERRVRRHGITPWSLAAIQLARREIAQFPLLRLAINNTAATLDGSHYVTATWTPALGVNKYGILQQNSAGGNPDQWNLLMSNISCSTNPCTANITTDSSTYASGYPSDNETGGIILRGAIKFGKSATQPAALDFTYATVAGFPASNLSNGTNGKAGTAVVLATSPTLVTPNIGAATTGNQITSTLATGTAPFSIASTTPVANLTTVPLTYNHSGIQQTATHLVVDSCTLGTDCSVTLAGAAAFTSSSSYSCVCQEETAMASCKVVQTSGSRFAITGKGTDTIRYFCTGN